jgi:hypothetical protein
MSMLIRWFKNMTILPLVYVMLLSATASADPLWAPSHRYGPDVLDVVAERWDGYESYDGYFWMHHGFKWTNQELNNFNNDPALSRNEHFAVYEFRRVDAYSGAGTEGSGSNDHWDGAWGKDECAWFIFCFPYQAVYTEYITSLPSPNNKGLEEHDGWFSQRHALSLFPPSWSFDYCDVVEKYGANSVCDEEYEVGFDPNQLIANRYYYVALKYRTDRDDGEKPTKWMAEFEVHRPGSLFGIIPYYETKYSCATDVGIWEIDLSSLSYDETRHDLTVDGGIDRCFFDYDSDGILDKDDNCPRNYNPDQADGDGDSTGDACDEKPSVHWGDIDEDGHVGDNCPEVFNPDQSDTDGDGMGDACDGDDDGDGFIDISDDFPYDPGEWIDTDSDGVGDNADTDDDGDGYSDDEEIEAGTDPLNPFSFPVPDPPPDPIEPDSDGDGLIDSVDSDDDDDCYPDSVETSLGSDPLNPLSRPADNDSDCSPDALDADDDNDGVPDSGDAFPFDPAEWMDTDGDGLGDNADADDDGDGMPDAWETLYGLDPLDAGDADEDADDDGYSNFAEFMEGTDPTSSCSPPRVNLCYDFIDENGNGQCGGALGIHCVPLGEWTPQMLIDTDGKIGGCRQKFMLQSDCDVDLEICVDFFVSPGGDGGQCKNQGVHCAGINQWTVEMGLDMDGRGGWCNQQFFVLGESEHFTLFMDFIGDDGLDSAGQCKVTGTSKAYSEYGTGTAIIGLDTDNRPGGCFQKFMLDLGTWSITAF